jgi:DNA-binding phage protein
MAKMSKFDAVDYLKSPEQIAAYLAEAFEADNASVQAVIMDTALRAKERLRSTREGNDDG